MDEAERDGAPDQQADKIASAVISYGRRFYPLRQCFSHFVRLIFLFFFSMIIMQLTSRIRFHSLWSNLPSQIRACVLQAGHPGCLKNVGFRILRYGTSSTRCTKLRYDPQLTQGNGWSNSFHRFSPFNEQENVQAISSDIANLFKRLG